MAKLITTYLLELDMLHSFGVKVSSRESWGVGMNRLPVRLTGIGG